MKHDQLIALGFDICGGQVDYRGKNYGMLTVTGVALTPEGEELIAELQGGDGPKAPVAAAAAKTTRTRAAKNATAAAPAAPTEPAGEDETADLAGQLASLAS